MGTADGITAFNTRKLRKSQGDTNDVLAALVRQQIETNRLLSILIRQAGGDPNSP